MGPWLSNYGIKTAFLLSANYAAGKEQMAAFKNTFEESGGKIVGEEYTPHRKTKDFGPYLGRIKNSGAVAVYVFYAGGEAINFIKQAHSFGLSDVMKITGAGWTTSPLFIPAQKESALGFIGILNYVPSIETDVNKNLRMRHSPLYILNLRVMCNIALSTVNFYKKLYTNTTLFEKNCHSFLYNRCKKATTQINA